MTDLLEPTDREGPVGDETRCDGGERMAPGPVRVDRRALPVPDALRWAGAAANLGAALIHFAYAPAHFGEEASHGAFFLAVGWAQLALALGLALHAAPRRAWAGASVLVNAGVIGV